MLKSQPLIHPLSIPPPGQLPQFEGTIPWRPSNRSMSSCPVPTSSTKSIEPKTVKSQFKALSDAYQSNHHDAGQSTQQAEERHDSYQQPLKPDLDHGRQPLQFLVHSQENVARLRLQVQERRTALRMKRRKVSESDRQFMDELYRWWGNGRKEDYVRLAELYEECKAARREIGPAEDDYENLELQLGEVEYANTRDTQRLTTALQNNTPDEAYAYLEDSRDSISDSHISFESSRSDYDERVKGNDELGIVEGQVLPGDLTSLALHQHEQTLSGFSMMPTRIRNEGIDLTTTAGQNTQEIRSSSVDYPSSGNELSAIWNPMPTECERPAMEEDLRNGESGQDLLPLLFPKKEVAESDSQSTLSDYLLDFQTPHNRINRWLLHRLRMSYTEAMNLKQAVSETGIVDNQWPSQALKLWEKDAAAISPFETDSTEPTIGFDPIAHLQAISMQQHIRSEPFDGIAPSPTPLDSETHKLDRSSKAFSRATDLPLFLWETVIQNPELLDQV